MRKIRALVLAGDGINCEAETAYGFELAGALPTIVHMNDLLKNKNLLQDFQVLALPGGFSFGDDLGSGQILALKIKHLLIDQFLTFIEQKKPIIGICNGFQILARLGILPSYHEKSPMVLDENKNKRFINRWVEIKINQNSSCVWTTLLKDISKFSLPIRHAEGVVTFPEKSKKDIYNRLVKNGQIPFYYKEDVNGSYKKIAAISDPSGLILGMMPHPEGFLSNLLHPTLSQGETKFEEGLGLLIFKSIIKYIEEK